jgi:hypothetical protein
MTNEGGRTQSSVDHSVVLDVSGEPSVSVGVHCCYAIVLGPTDCDPKTVLAAVADAGYTAGLQTP